jgi:hypothetical protein
MGDWPPKSNQSAFYLTFYFADVYRIIRSIPTSKPYGTRDHYQRVVRVHYIPYVGDALLPNVTQGDQVQGFVPKKLTEGRFTPKTINNSVVLVKTIF